MPERDERFPLPTRDIRTILFVALGGSLGAIARAAILLAFPVAREGFPAGTLVVNLGGSLILGVALGWFETPRGQQAPAWLRPFALAGFAGAFTTLSLVVVDQAILISAGRNLEALLFALVTLAGTIVVALVGILIGRRAGRSGASG